MTQVGCLTKIMQGWVKYGERHLKRMHTKKRRPAISLPGLPQPHTLMEKVHALRVLHIVYDIARKNSIRGGSSAEKLSNKNVYSLRIRWQRYKIFLLYKRF